jgi:acyl carrier protein
VESAVSLIEETLELDPGSITGEERLEDLNWDSLSVISFMAIADERLGLRLSPRDINACTTVSQLVGLLPAGAPPGNAP